MNFIANFKNIIIAAGLAMVFGFGGGYYAKSELLKADRVDQLVEAQHATAQGIKQSLAENHVVETAVAESNTKVDVIRQIVAKRIEKKEPTSETASSPESRSLACVWSLDVGTVSLLDAARDNSVDTPVLRDGEGAAPSPVGQAAFIDNDLQIVKQYHDLASRHDALVDWVQVQVDKQAK